MKTTKVSLRFAGDALEPRELTERLGGAPTSAAAKGETWLTPAGVERLATTGRWLLRLDAGDADSLSDQIARLFVALTPEISTWRDLSQRHRGNLFVGLFLGSANEGLDLAPETMTAIGERGLSLQLDIYERDPREQVAFPRPPVTRQK